MSTTVSKNYQNTTEGKHWYYCYKMDLFFLFIGQEVLCTTFLNLFFKMLGNDLAGGALYFALFSPTGLVITWSSKVQKFMKQWQTICQLVHPSSFSAMTQEL